MSTTTTMKAVQIKKFNDPFHVSNDVKKPKPEPHQVLIKIKAGGFCHTDLMALNNEFQSPLPYIGSHEPAGIIEELGSNVKNYKIGDRVGAIAFDSACGKCPDCKTGRSKYCDNPKMMKGITGDGAWAEYMVSDAATCVLIPDTVPFEQAAAHMCAGLTMYGALVTADMPKGSTIAILGIGGLGHIGTQIAKARGYTVVAIDTKQDALDLSMKFKHKPDILFNPEKQKVEDIVEELHKINPDKNGFKGVDCSIISTDAPPSFKTAVEITKKHGKLVLVGQPADGITLGYVDLIFKDLRLVGSLLASAEQGKELMELVGKEKIEVEVKKWKMDQVEEMRQEYLTGRGKGKNVLMID